MTKNAMTAVCGYDISHDTWGEGARVTVHVLATADGNFVGESMHAGREVYGTSIISLCIVSK